MQRQITPNGYHNNRDISSPSHNDSDYKYGRFDASALHIAHALKQTEIQKAYNKRREKPIDYYLVSTWDIKSNVLVWFSSKEQKMRKLGHYSIAILTLLLCDSYT